MYAYQSLTKQQHRGDDHAVELLRLQLTDPRIQIPAQRNDLQIGPPVPELHAPPERAGPDPRPAGHLLHLLISFRDQDVPRILSGPEWRSIKQGLAQRIRALNHFVDDVYHGREIVREGIVPWSLIAGRSHFARAVHGIRPPGGVYCHVAGCDLVRDSDGTWKVLEDNVRTPSGISYVLENRVAMARLVPDLFAAYRVRPVDQYPQLLLAALRSVAPSADSEATVVVWTPGPLNSAYLSLIHISEPTRPY